MDLSQGYGNLPAYIPTQTPYSNSNDCNNMPPPQLIGPAHVTPSPNQPTIIHQSPFIADPAGLFQQRKFVHKLYYATNHDQTGAIRWNETGDGFLLDHGLFSLYYLATGYFKSSKMTSFVRQMALYGFRKTDKPKMASLLNKEQTPIGILDTGLMCREYKHPHFLRDYPTLVDNIHRLEAVNPGSRKRKRPVPTEGDEAAETSKVMRNEREELKDEDNCDEDIGTVPASRMLPPPPPLQQLTRNFTIPNVFPWINPMPRAPTMNPTTAYFNFMQAFAAAAASSFNFSGAGGAAIPNSMEQPFAEMVRNPYASNYQPQAPMPMAAPIPVPAPAPVIEESSQTMPNPPPQEYTHRFPIRSTSQEYVPPLDSDGYIPNGTQYEPTDLQQQTMVYVPQEMAADAFFEPEKINEEEQREEQKEEEEREEEEEEGEQEEELEEGDEEEGDVEEGELEEEHEYEEEEDEERSLHTPIFDENEEQNQTLETQNPNLI